MWRRAARSKTSGRCRPNRCCRAELRSAELHNRRRRRCEGGQGWQGPSGALNFQNTFKNQDLNSSLPNQKLYNHS